MNRRRIVLAFLVSTGFAATLFGQCTSFVGNAGQGSGPWININNVSYPNDSVLQQGVAGWNNSTCNQNGTAFPPFMLGTSQPPAGSPGAQTINVRYEAGPGNGECGHFGDGSTITLYGTAILANDPNRVVTCSSSVEDFEHELGHVLDLSHSSCSGYIMSGDTVDAQGNFSSRWIHDDECTAAAAKWTTPAETPPPPSGGGGYDPNWGGGGYNQDTPCYPNMNWCSPIVINFENGDYRLTGKNAPVLFDIRGDGHPLLMGWTAAGADEAFLWLDRNHNSRVTSGAELFGNFTLLQNGHRAKNGFEALAEFDANHDGVIDDHDSIWSQLLLWRDLNHNGISEPSEISPLDTSDLTAIDLHDHWAGKHDQWGNAFRYESVISIRNQSGHAVHKQPVYDIFFVSVSQ